MTEWLFLLGGLLAGGMLAAVFFRWNGRRAPEPPVDMPNQGNPGEVQARLEIVQKLNRSLVEAGDEQHLLTELLGLMISLTKTAGATYIPLDELGQPLAQISQGVIPRYPYQPWSAHLTSEPVSEVCRVCQNLHKDTHTACPLAENPFVSEGEITCLAIQRGERRLGMINLYHHPGQTLDQEEIAFIKDMLAETSLAVDNLRLHNQEVATLRQLRLVHRSSDETTGLLSQLLNSTCEGLDCDLAVLSFTGSGQVPARIIRSRLSKAWQEVPMLREITSRVQNTGQKINLVGSDVNVPLPGFFSMLAMPVLISADNPPKGNLIVARVDALEFTPREERVVETIASQAALVVENQRKILELEYRAVMDERSRLAREIHDGLAQTLAFLKLQGAQMNGFLVRGELDRLGEMLHSNQQTLSDAYTETREAINHLRLSPQPGVRSWLAEALRDFRQTSHIEVSLDIVQDPENLAVEIQTQLIRIIQEALNNIRKHAHASHVKVTFREYQGDLVLEISDDGRGFLPEDVPSLAQYGLRGMRERAEMIGADFQIISQPGGGTTVRLQLPYAYTPEASL